ncbi:MAG: tetratricopeptide repeat protein [Nitrospirae bacterium]|nr:tetratricopeptide repeat protein [Nitrospirota bacterium]
MRILISLCVSLGLLSGVGLGAAAEPETGSQSDYFVQGVLASERGQVDRAIELFEAVVWLQPDHAEAQYNLGVLLGERERWDDAMVRLAKAADLRPKDHEPHLAMGLVASQKGDDELAIHEFIETLKLQPDLAEAHVRLGLIYQKRKLDDMATGQYRATIQTDPKNLTARFGLGFLADKKGDLDEAIRQFREITTIDPRNVEGHYNLGLAYGRKSMVGLADLPTPELTDYNALAMESFQKTLSWNPNHSGARYNLAVAYLYQGAGDVKRAREHLDILAGTDPALAEKLADKIESVTQKEGAH